MAAPDSTAGKRGERPGGHKAEVLRVDDADLRLVNRLLFVVAALLAALVVWRLWQIEHRRLAQPPEPPARPYTAGSVQPFESEDYYVQHLGSQDVFRRSLAERPDLPPDAAPRTPEETQKLLQALKRDLVVVGVAWREPRLVMVYDKREKTTHFLRMEQGIGEKGVKVRTISRDEIRIGLEDEEISLR